jgi:hypothetical protein
LLGDAPADLGNAHAFVSWTTSATKERSDISDDWRDDHRLLGLEIDTIFGLAPSLPGEHLRLVKSDVAAVFGWSPNSRVLALSAAATEVIDAIDLGAAGEFSPGIEPTVVAQVKNRLLDRTDPTTLSVAGGPSYVFPPSVEGPRVSLPIVVSDDAGVSAAQRFVRPTIGKSASGNS